MRKGKYKYIMYFKVILYILENTEDAYLTNPVKPQTSFPLYIFLTAPVTHKVWEMSFWEIKLCWNIGIITSSPSMWICLLERTYKHTKNYIWNKHPMLFICKIGSFVSNTFICDFIDMVWRISLFYVILFASFLTWVLDKEKNIRILNENS